MEGDDVGEHPNAGQDCPALSPSLQSLSTAGCDNVRVFQVPPEKRAVIEQILGGSKHFTSWKKAGMKLAGLFIIAACVNGELSPEPPAGESIHAHGGHENKRLLVRRPVVRKNDKPLPENMKSESSDGGHFTPSLSPDGGKGEEIVEMLALIDRKISAVQKDVGALRRAKVESPATTISDNDAVRLFALLKALESEANYRKAPVTRVFMLYCLDGKSRDAVARDCSCSPSLITLRLKAIELKLGRKPIELRQFSDQFERIADSLSDSRARRIDRRHAIEDDAPDDEV